ncbi:MAG: GTP-binding protein, partial [Synechococcaceae cyanobacterium]|nr:GTP-binding protein [Synechococcaceae cyanobacterium]
VALEELFEEQLAAADLVLVSRADRLEPQVLASVQQRLTPHLRPGTAVLTIAHGVAPVELLIDPARGEAEVTTEPGAPMADASHHHRDDGEHHHDLTHNHNHDHSLSNEHGGDHEHDRDDSHGHSHNHDHDHSHGVEPHAHRHVAMRSLVVQRQGSWQRDALERRLRQLIETQPVLRLKGRWQQSGKKRLLQIQAVGPRFDSWYEGEMDPDQTEQADRLELVLLTAEAHAEQVSQSLASL